MTVDPLWQEIAAALAAAQGLAPGKVERLQGCGGGCINRAMRLRSAGTDYFVKLNDADRLPMFAAEAEGLAALGACAALRVPRPVCHGVAGGSSYLVLEWLDLRRRGDVAAFGRALAALHRCRGEAYGWQRDNTIGSTAQPNPRSGDWAEFWGRHRLGFQLRLAAERGHAGRLQASGERLLQALPALLAGHRPPPSLLHGDLWSGNYAYLHDGRAALFDPAVYHGDRECDLAMTELFGGFPADFYAAYREAWPLDAGYALRRELYNLYHVLNHLNLFGGGYGAQAQGMMDRLLAELA